MPRDVPRWIRDEWNNSPLLAADWGGGLNLFLLNVKYLILSDFELVFTFQNMLFTAEFSIKIIFKQLS